MKKTIVSVMLVLVCVFSLFSCKSRGVENTESNCIIGIFDGGYGVSAMEKIAEAFNALEENKQKGHTVSVVNQGRGFVGSNVYTKLQGAIGDFDLIFTGDVRVYRIIDEGSEYLKGYDYALEDISDVYEKNVYGEEILFKDKMVKQFYDYNTFHDSQYSITWATGPSGIAYRADFFEENGWSIPRTTDELIELAAKIVEDGYTPYIWSTSGSYWYYSVLTWWRQLITDEEFNDFWNGIDKNGDVSATVYRSESRLLALQELDRILGGHYTLENNITKSDGYLFDTGSKSNIGAQTSLYTTANKICMMANSDWLENEMKSVGYNPGDVDIGIFKTPIISSILYKCDYEYHEPGTEEAWRFKTIRDELTLRNVITAIDEGKTEMAGIDAADFAALKKIRSYTGTEAQNHSAFIPAYANAKEVAKEFLSFLASDQALQIYYDEVGAFLPFDISGLKVNSNTTFKENVYAMAKDANYVSTFDSQNPLFYKTDLNFFMSTKPEQVLANPENTDPTVDYAREYWQDMYQRAEDIWDDALADANS